jgi:hypothetical protein
MGIFRFASLRKASPSWGVPRISPKFPQDERRLVTLSDWISQASRE